jgi:hypothetical protein
MQLFQYRWYCTEGLLPKGLLPCQPSLPTELSFSYPPPPPSMYFGMSKGELCTKQLFNNAHT